VGRYHTLPTCHIVRYRLPSLDAVPTLSLLPALFSKITTLTETHIQSPTSYITPEKGEDLTASSRIANPRFTCGQGLQRRRYHYRRRVTHGADEVFNYDGAC
jgi:hypothetical protein